MSETPSQPAPETGEVPVLTARGVRENHKSSSIRGHDFRQSGFLTPSELRRIRQRHEQIVRALAARLAVYLRLEFSLQLSKVQIVGYQKFTESLPNPTHISLFKTEPLKGVGLLVMPLRMALMFVDRMLGGPGQMPEESRELTEIEVVLTNQVSQLIINEWCNHWPELRELKPSLLGHENNSRFLQTATPDTAILILSLVGGIGEQTETIQLSFPYATLEPLMRLLVPAHPAEEDTPLQVSPPTWNPVLNEIKVPVLVEWEGLKLSASDITRLKPGDLLLLDQNSATEVQVLFNRIPKFTGRPGTTGGKWAVQLTAPIQNPQTA